MTAAAIVVDKALITGAYCEAHTCRMPVYSDYSTMDHVLVC